jgi:hypothetical protein
MSLDRILSLKLIKLKPEKSRTMGEYKNISELSISGVKKGKLKDLEQLLIGITERYHTTIEFDRLVV